METETVSLFFALLSLLALAAAAVLGVVGLVSWRSGGTRGAGLRADVGSVALWLGFAVALTATLGSLYYSEIAKFTPCKLCWYQRIAMYPLVLLLGIAAVRRDRGIRVYALAQAGVGAAIAAYHTYLQAFPDSSSSFCTVDAPCTLRHVWELGFVSIPFMALAGFLLIIALLAVGSPIGGRGNDLAGSDDQYVDVGVDDHPGNGALVGATPAPADQESPS
ncbi:MAG: disulfide oxidoreductase [Acidimicrobiales bacterium]